MGPVDVKADIGRVNADFQRVNKECLLELIFLKYLIAYLSISSTIIVVLGKIRSKDFSMISNKNENQREK